MDGGAFHYFVMVRVICVKRTLTSKPCVVNCIFDGRAISLHIHESFLDFAISHFVVSKLIPAFLDPPKALIITNESIASSKARHFSLPKGFGRYPSLTKLFSLGVT